MASNIYDIASSAAMDAFHDSLSTQGQLELGYIVTVLWVDPWPDNRTKFEYQEELAGQRGLVVYDDGVWSLLYKIEGDTIVLWAGGRRGQEPSGLGMSPVWRILRDAGLKAIGVMKTS